MRNAARLAERVRCNAILTAPEAEGKRELAQHLVGVDLSAEEAIGILRVAGRPQKKDDFLPFMRSIGAED